MRLQLILTVVKAGELVVPKRCPHKGWTGAYLRLYQKVGKRLKDTVHRQVTVHRNQCVDCGRTFRVYPPGVTNALSVPPTKVRTITAGQLQSPLTPSRGAANDMNQPYS